MRRFFLILCFTCLPSLAHAWNAAGHRLTAAIAWQQLSPPSRQRIGEMLARHPDYARWTERAGSSEVRDIFAEAATWPDDIRHDPRFYDERRDPPTASIPGLPDSARHKAWHYVDLADDGKRQAGELDLQIERLAQLIGSGETDVAWALPWLLHLVADIHQPLHAGKHEDEGGNSIEIKNPFSKGLPFSSLHTYWDNLPGPSRLRGQPLAKQAGELLARYPAPRQGNVRLWRNESHRLLAAVYPPQEGSLLPTITEEFQHQASELAGQRIVDAGYRLGRLLESLLARRVSRETR